MFTDGTRLENVFLNLKQYLVNTLYIIFIYLLFINFATFTTLFPGVYERFIPPSVLSPSENPRKQVSPIQRWEFIKEKSKILKLFFFVEILLLSFFLGQVLVFFFFPGRERIYFIFYSLVFYHKFPPQ